MSKSLAGARVYNFSCFYPSPMESCTSLPHLLHRSPRYIFISCYYFTSAANFSKDSNFCVFFSLNYYNPQVLFVVLASPFKLPEQSDFRARRIIVQTALFLTEHRFIPLLNSTLKIRREPRADPPLSELSPFPTLLWRRSAYWQPHSSVHQRNPQHEASNEINEVF